MTVGKNSGRDIVTLPISFSDWNSYVVVALPGSGSIGSLENIMINSGELAINSFKTVVVADKENDRLVNWIAIGY